MESSTSSLSFVLADPVRWNEWQYLLQGYAFRCGAQDYLNDIQYKMQKHQNNYSTIINKHTIIVNINK